MSPKGWLVPGLLIASVGLNGYLLLRGGADRAHTAEDAGERGEGRADVARAPEATATRSARSAASAASAASPVGGDSTGRERSELTRAELERRLAEVEAERDALLPLHERFLRGEASEQLEARLRPLFEKVLELEPGTAPVFDLVCRGDICRIDADPKASASDWQMRIQTDPLTADLDEESMFQQGEAYLKISPDDVVAGRRFAAKVAQAFRQSSAVAACKRTHPTPGTLELRLTFDASARRVGSIASGELAGNPIADCLRRVLEDVAAAITLPAEPMRLPSWPIQVEVP